MTWTLFSQIMILMLWSAVCINSLKLRRGPRGETGPVGPKGETGETFYLEEK